MSLTSLLLGAGSLLVAVILKSTPEKWVDYISFELDEDGLNKGTDIISQAHEKIVLGFKRSETERLLDSA